ncbi:cobalamin-binding protein [Paenibacillus sp. CAA11]|uniref:ABC transporter substrate-binding protein n=1 Tax=Paenibacillus sp. CAA11 TaxID=1532905 RepID=UPI000D3AED9C|nr:ABC transporter substrate-binding protein [Paenibacillus sp. CAA11]AWB43853.1 cobalamin-binding protein [Paenibacillus sp. CAA11]
MKKWTKLWGAWLVVLALVVLAGCGSNEAQGNKQAANQTKNTAQQEAAAPEQQAAAKTAYPLTLTDGTGQEITFEAAPQRIVSLAPSETETLFALGLDEQIVGVTDLDDYPEAAKSKPKMGGFPVNTEAVVAAKPDVVFVAGISDEKTIQSLRDLGLKVFQFNPKTLDAVIKDIGVYGQITDHQAEAKQVTDNMEQQLKQVTDAVKSVTPDQKKKVYIEFSEGWTVGKGEFMDEMITLAGGINVAGDTTSWNAINEEKIIKSNPDVILYAKSVVNDKNQTLDQIIKGRAGWDQITAIKENRIAGLDDNMLSRTGPRLTEGLIEIAKAVYPELMQ